MLRKIILEHQQPKRILVRW